MKCVLVLPLNSVEAYHVTLQCRTPGASLVGGWNVRTGECSAEEGLGYKVRRYPTLISLDTYRSLMPGMPEAILGATGCSDGNFDQKTIS